MMFAKKVNKTPSFDEIMAQTSIIGALEKNKVAYVKLNSYVKDLDDKFAEKMIKIDQENMNNKQFIYNLDRELRSNSKAYKEKHEKSLKPKPLNDLHRKLNDKSLPELITNENPYVKHIKFDAIDKSNYFLPVLIQNLQRQQHYTHSNLKDLVEKNKTSQKLSAYKRMKESSSLNNEINSGRSLTAYDKNQIYNNNDYEREVSDVTIEPLKTEKTMTDVFNLKNEDIIGNNNQQQQNTSRSNKVNQSTPDSRISVTLSSRKSKDSLDVMRSIRRERMDPREINDFYESKMNLLRIAKRFDQYRSTCTKKCEFKHTTFLNTHNTTKNKHFVDEYND